MKLLDRLFFNGIKAHNLKKLEAIRSLGDNWNGNGAAAFNPALVDKVENMINELIIQPEIFPTALNTIQLEYDNSRKDHMEIEICEDDMAEVYENLQAADGIILATPIQSGSISANLSIIMDRTRALEAIDYNLLRGKIGMSIAVGGDRTGGQDFAHLANISYFMIHGIIPVSGGPFGSNLGASFWSQDSLDKIKEDEYGMESLNRTLIEFENFLNKYI